MDKGKLRILFLTVITCFFSLLSGAQPAVKTAVDKNEILIGDQFKLSIEASFSPVEYKIKWPVIPDSLQHFEVISRGKIDSLYNNSRLTGMVQTITLTSFDSGKWILPSFLLNLVPEKGDTSYNFFTDSVPITVSFSTSDTTSQLRDIKPIMEVETTNPVWYWIGVGVLLIVLIIFIIWFYRRWKKNKVAFPVKTKILPYDEAMKELENLKTYNLSVPAEIKIVHTKLSEILKRYLSRVQNNNYLNKTSGDILILLRDQYLDKDLPAKTAAVLRSNDAVKFAKYLPPANETEASILSIKEVIGIIQRTINAQSVTLHPKP